MKILTSGSTAFASLSLFIASSGCAHREPPPLELVGAAKMAIHEAERNDHTAQQAPKELQSAQDKSQEAQQALQRKDYLRARRLSEQAIVDAQLAQARTQTALAIAGAREERDALRDVHREIERKE